jgi:hypothetical protein
MKIFICGSMHFSKEMLELEKKLEAAGHWAKVPCDTNVFAQDSSKTTDNHEENYKYCLENDIVRQCFNDIAESDAILVANYPKEGIDGYIGGSVLMEMGLAYYLKKKIFMMFPPPPVSEAKHSHEVLIMQPEILNGNLSLIK